MTKELFRKEAIRHRTRALYGDVVLATPRVTWILTALLIVIMVGVMSFIIWGTKSESLSGHTILAPNSYNVTTVINDPNTEIIMGNWASLKPSSPQGRTLSFGGTVQSVQHIKGQAHIIIHISSMNMVTTPSNGLTKTALPLNVKVTTKKSPIWRWAIERAQ